jgi:tetratricopeptide (TPR) repeat protein
VTAAPPIPGLTEHAGRLSEADWLRLLARLRRLKLIAPEGHHRPDVVDAHPLVREHFGEQLRREALAAWREAHGRLYEHYKSAAKEFPDTIEEMAPLYAAVAHGCRASRHQDALDEVYWRRIQRGNDYFSAKKLGAVGADLAALSGFFDPPWRRPVNGLTEGDKSFVLGEAGYRLRALGRLADAVEPMQAGLDADKEGKDWRNAARQTGNLSELSLAAGDVTGAIRYAKQSVELADRSGDAFLRMASRTTLAGALHQAGDVEKADAAFREAEAMQAEQQPAFPLLYSLRCYQYCDLLLGGGQYAEVRRRASQTLEWMNQYGGLLDVALDHLSLGRAYLGQAVTASGDSIDIPSAASPGMQDLFSQAAGHLDQAVDGLRRSSNQDEVPRGLLARAAQRRATGAHDRARADLDEALSIATRGGMRLHETDCHLEYARLCLATGETDAAREHLARAKAMVADTGYHRRDGEVAALEQETGVRGQESGVRGQGSGDRSQIA